jgi:hypothetical protein
VSSRGGRDGTALGDPLAAELAPQQVRERADGTSVPTSTMNGKTVIPAPAHRATSRW